MSYKVVIAETDLEYRCTEDQTVLGGMERLGCRGIPVGCRQGGCGVCKIEVMEGQYRKRVMSRSQVSEEDEAAGRVLACRIWPESDMKLRVIGKMARALPVAGSSATPFSLVAGAYEAAKKI
jgi:ferredoxin